MFTSLDAGLAILRAAQRFIDLHEVQSNATWSRPEDSDALRVLLKETGWQPGWPYCMAACEACWGLACRELAPEAEAILRAKFTLSVMQTYANVKERVIRTAPPPGSIGFMQKGTSGLGHAFMVVMAGAKTVSTVEGNTSPGVQPAGTDREGDGWYLKIRRIDYTPSAGLHLLGFLPPPDSARIAELLG